MRPKTVSPEPLEHDLALWAQRIHARGWSTAALLALDVLKPLGFLCSQAITLLEPLLMAQGRERAHRWASLLEDQSQIERLQQLIESADAP